MPKLHDPSRTSSPNTLCTTCQRRPAAGAWNGRPTCRPCHGRALARLIDSSRSASTQPYRTTRAAQQAARRLADEPTTPHPPTTQIRVYEADGRTTTIRPLADVLSPKTRATLAALKGGR